MNRPRALLAWSSGKDSAWALHVLRTTGGVEVAGLLTTVVEGSGRVTMHRVPEVVLDAQAAALGLPLWKVRVPDPCPNEVYEQVMEAEMDRALREGVTVVAFGDLYLEDIRQYRESRLAGMGVTPVFPLWGLDTSELARGMIQAGLRARVVSVDTSRLDPTFAGREFDEVFLKDLPRSVDPCGEHGEFHTVVYAGPMFERTLSLSTGDTYRSGPFLYSDVTLASGSALTDT